MPPELPRCVFQGSSVHAIVEARLDTQTIFGFRCEVFSETRLPLSGVLGNLVFDILQTGSLVSEN
jgi:hypothetical protein